MQIEQSEMFPEKKEPGRPRKYSSEKEKKEAHKEAQRKYREQQKSAKNERRQPMKEFNVLLPWGEFLNLVEISGKTKTEFMSQVINIIYDYSNNLQKPKQITKQESEKKLIEQINDLINITSDK